MPEMKRSSVSNNQSDLDLEGYDNEESMPILVKESYEGMFQKDGGYGGFWEDEELENKEDYEIRPSDCLLLAGKIEQEFSSIEVYVYDEESFRLWLHHDFMISAFPTCIEWLGIQSGQVENTGTVYEYGRGCDCQHGDTFTRI